MYSKTFFAHRVSQAGTMHIVSKIKPAKTHNFIETYPFIGVVRLAPHIQLDFTFPFLFQLEESFRSTSPS